MPNFILIDGSYYIFYRYFAILQWYKCSHKGVKPENPSENAEFVEKFRTTFVSKLKNIPKKTENRKSYYYCGQRLSARDNLANATFQRV